MISVNSPFDDHLIKNVAYTTDAEIENIILQAHEIFLDKSNWLTASSRISILENIYKIMQVKKSELAFIAAEEGGKPLTDSRLEVERALESILIAKNNIANLVGNEVPMQLNAASLNKRAYTMRMPVGVVYAISAFNHPINLVVHQAVSAIAAGCPVIVKPASSTPLSCLAIMQIIYEAGLPKPWCQAVLCDNNIAEKIVSDPRLRYFSFVGSSKVGWYLRTKLAPGTKCSLEHGGAAPVIVEPDADLEKVVPDIVRGGFYHAGQVCVSTQRVYVHQKIMKSFTNKILEQVDKLKIGDPILETTDIGPLISKAALHRVEDWVNEASYKGGKVLIGGKMTNNSCFEPTVILDVPPTATLATHEVFGPVISLHSYNKITEALSAANNVPYHFQSSIYTNNIDTAWQAIKELNANTVLINEHTAFRVDWMPFAGQNESGLGVGGIPYAMEEMTYLKQAIWHSSQI